MSTSSQRSPGVVKIGHVQQLEARLSAINTYQATIEFQLDGTIITANQNFLDATGYTLSEIQGRHHSIFVEPAHRLTPEYKLFWERLGRGEADQGQYRRIRKNGQELWLQASYNPISDQHGKPYMVVKYASDITAAKQKQADAESQLHSIGANQAVIEFKLDGTIVSANQNFLNATGYTLAEIQGRHHAIFVDPKYAQSPEYRSFWEKLGRGEADSGQYKRIRKDGGEVWLQASYNPIFDLDGKPIKIIKYASDITSAKRKQADADSQLCSIGTYQAVIEFKLDGTIVFANQNFLDAVGYSLADIQGKHHSIFVDAAHRQSQEYRYFWEKLGRGEGESGQYKRLRRNGSEVWLQASYNPIFDLDGKPVKVIKYASDITAHKEMEQHTYAAMAETARVMKELAAGNLQEMMTGDVHEQFLDLKDSVNSCVTHLRETVTRIRHAGSTLSVSASEIAIGNEDLSTRTEQQASTLAATAASMEQLTGTVKQNAGSAREASQLAVGARHEAERGGAVVEAAITAMKAINEASNHIADIIGVIDEIAFQTNLLALNAAVEAARAGEQGRGFAVVAAEVRNLAQRSAGAAKEIKALIKDSVGKVDEGSRLVRESGSMLQQIVTAAKKVSDIISEIASASAEQATGIDSIGDAIQKMDVVVQQNSALVEEGAAASTMMDEQTKDLEKLMQFFKLSDDEELLTPSRKETAVVSRRAVPPARANSPRPAKSHAFSATETMEEF